MALLSPLLTIRPLGFSVIETIKFTLQLEAHMAYDTLFGERRLHQRKSCALSITIDDYKRNYSGYLINLSLGGALIEPASQFKAKIGQELMLTIPFRKKNGFTMVKGKVTRTRNERIVVMFMR